MSEHENEIQIFKALITIHKVCQEGHPSCLAGAYRNIPWIESLGRYRSPDGQSRYERLIHEYTSYLVQKFRFHHDHRGFNGTFEYKEYISLIAVSDPNEGYQNIIDLEDLQDSLDNLGRLVLASASQNRGNECMTSALVPLVAESYGIYKFQISMLRAMYSSSSSPEALEPLKERFDEQHHRLYDFYADCSSIRYLTSLITIPKLPVEPPNLLVGDDDNASGVDSQGVKEMPSVSTSPSIDSSSDSRLAGRSGSVAVQQTGAVANAFDIRQKKYEQQQSEFARQQEERNLAQQRQQQQQQQYWQQQQQLAQQQQEAAQKQLMLDQAQKSGPRKGCRIGKGFVQSLENELNNTTNSAQQQIASKDEQLQSLNEQIIYWRKKYESLAKLYTQLRTEHLNLLSKFKKVQQKASSAQEAVERRERLEKDMKAKNVELADLIKERDRTRLQLERVKGSQKDSLEKLQLEKGDLEDKLRRRQQDAQKQLEDMQEKFASQLKLTAKSNPKVLDLEDKLREKEMELEAMQQTMDETVNDLAEQQKSKDLKLKETHSRLLSLVDAILKSGVKRIQDSVFMLDSPMEAGNGNASPSYISTLIEKCSNSATEFSNSFNAYLIDGPKGDVVNVIDTITGFATSVSDILMSTKGLTRLTESGDFQDDLIDTARDVAEMAQVFLESLISSNRQGNTIESQTDKVINGNVDLQEILQTLLQLVESLVAPGSQVNLERLSKGQQELGEVVDKEMENASATIDAASRRLKELLKANVSGPSVETIDVQVNNSILGSALAIIDAVKLLINASISSQEEIVNKGRGSHSRSSFYKKNNRWTEGLISAAKAIAYSSNVLIQIADGTLQGNNSNEELIVASREVAASTAQLVAAARVKSDLMSKTESNLEGASKKVNAACRKLVAKVNELITSKNVMDDVDYSKMNVHENKTAEMEQQVEILKLEKALDVARKRLGEIRKFSYKDDQYVIDGSSS
ncbi:hypothetical protein HII12_005162 [Brettanomyces bruxellensis]|uniref:Cytoskeleton assembly control protein n=1 Tax=Dekkera bruxellensis TaxID=5007 RepID=A0A8H6B663_DEKBR|nr:hypothetical protein HII12_005162 [Brettanomyces bruxellensis]